ncbi:MAG: metallophosphoesterase [Prevotella sp.]|nr:metallophosphoesterase [Prevotella sp.]
MKFMWMIVFMVLPLLAIVYLGWHVWVLLPVSSVWKSLLIIAGVLCFSMLFLSVGRKFDQLPLPVAQLLYEVGTSSLIVMLYLVMIFFVLDIGRIIHLVPKSLLYANWPMAVGIFAFVFGIFLYGNLHYKHKVRVPLELTTSKPLPKEYKILMASDLHLGYHNPCKELARWVDLMNAENPDFILIAGDIIDGSMRPLIEEDMAKEFQRLQAPVYACLGNHEYYAGEPQAQQFIRDSGIRLLIDEAAEIDSCIVVVGRDDRTNHRRKPIKELVADTGKYTIVLDHQPYNLERTESAGADFQLSGHTHRGQIWPISWITDALYECSWGRHQRGNTHYYVTSGIGLWGGKFRIGTQSEYVVVRLISKDSD